MDLYDRVSSDLSRNLTLGYSTSFSAASRLYSPSIRPHIYNIYGWVRIGDEIADTYRGHNAGELLERFRKDTYQALKDSYSPNPIIHAFALTAHAFGINQELIDPFLKSMIMDLNPPKKFTKAMYDTYIYGSAEVVGLMCLKVFTSDDEVAYEHLRPGAEALGSAFQKINFLRDFAHDTKVLKRSYFPNVKNNKLTEEAKAHIVQDIRHDLTHAIPALDQLPKSARAAVMVAARYYYELLNRLEASTAEVISEQRIRVPDWRKAQILASAKAARTLKRSNT